MVWTIHWVAALGMEINSPGYSQVVWYASLSWCHEGLLCVKIIALSAAKILFNNTDTSGENITGIKLVGWDISVGPIIYRTMALILRFQQCLWHQGILFCPINVWFIYVQPYPSHLPLSTKAAHSIVQMHNLGSFISWLHDTISSLSA